MHVAYLAEIRAFTCSIWHQAIHRAKMKPAGHVCSGGARAPNLKNTSLA